MTKEEIQLLAFQMISLAGEAIDFYYKALEEYQNEEYDLGKEYWDNGNEKLNECHQIQTNLIQAESKGEDIPYSLIMSHAQDHFTNATNWKMFAKLFMKN